MLFVSLFTGRYPWLFALLLLSGSALAQGDADSVQIRPRREVYDLGRHGTYRYERPRFLAPIRDAPRDFWEYGRHTLHRRSLPGFGIMAASTALLLLVDQPLVDGTRQFANHIGLDHSSEQDVVFGKQIGMLKLAVRYPVTLNSTFYWLGEGAPSLVLAGGLWASGLIGRDNRRLATASQLLENALITGIVVQAIKRSTGRETPRLSTQPGGRWRPFPNPFTYQKHVPMYDAFPSGHFSTLASTFTTLAENYPEKRWIYPVGGVVMGAVGYAMMNTGVHWASDYPLSIALGYSFSRLNARRHRTRLDASPLGLRQQSRWLQADVFPTVLPGGTAGVAVAWRW